MKKVGHWAFVAGIVIAVIAGVASSSLQAYGDFLGFLLVVLGLIVGFLNIQHKESHNFLLATVALMLVGSAGLERLPQIGIYLQPALKNIAVFVAPAALIVALKVVYELGKS